MIILTFINKMSVLSSSPTKNQFSKSNSSSSLSPSPTKDSKWNFTKTKETTKDKSKYKNRSRSNSPPQISPTIPTITKFNFSLAEKSTPIEKSHIKKPKPVLTKTELESNNDIKLIDSPEVNIETANVNINLYNSKCYIITTIKAIVFQNYAFISGDFNTQQFIIAKNIDKFTTLITNYEKNNNNIKLAHSLIDNNIKDCSKPCIDLFELSNERLEWFGDAKLSDIISTYLEMRYINDDEGFLTELRSKLVRKETLAKLGKQLGFNDYICMAKQIEYFEDGRNSQDNIEDCFEAFIGALYKELKEVNQEYKLTNFIINIYESEINFAELIEQDLNFKKQLMEYYHKKVNKNPIYKEEDKDNDLYNMTVLDPINKGIIGYGSDKLKKKAEMKAAEVALQYLRLL